MTRLFCVCLLSWLGCWSVAVHATPASQELDLVFFPETYGPTIWLGLASTTEQGRTQRRAQLAWWFEDTSFDWETVDEVDGAALRGPLPDTPLEVLLDVNADGSLLLRIPAPEHWAAAVGDAARAREPGDPALASPAAARLLIAASPVAPTAAWESMPASLFGLERRVSGSVMVRRGSGQPPGAFIFPPNSERAAAHLPEGAPSVFVADVVARCGLEIPRTFLYLTGGSDVRAIAHPERSVCLARSALIPFDARSIEPDGRSGAPRPGEQIGVMHLQRP